MCKTKCRTPSVRPTARQREQPQGNDRLNLEISDDEVIKHRSANWKSFPFILHLSLSLSLSLQLVYPVSRDSFQAWMPFDALNKLTADAQITGIRTDGLLRVWCAPLHCLPQLAVLFVENGSRVYWFSTNEIWSSRRQIDRRSPHTHTAGMSWAQITSESLYPTG